MSTVKKGVLTASLEWARHLRPFYKRKFWKRERKAGRQSVRLEQPHGDEDGRGK